MKLVMRQTIAEISALDGEGYCIRKRGAEHARVKVGVANITWPIQGREMGSPRLTESKISSLISREGGSGIK